MIKKLSFLVVAVMFSIAANGAYAHGGQYTGPGGGGTPGYDGPAGGGGTGGPGTGGPAGGGGGTTGGGGGTTGGGGTGPVGPVRPGGGAPSGGAGGAGRGGTTGGRRKSSAPSTTTWDWWWDLNEERFLNLKNAVRNSGAASDDQDEFLGDSSGGDDIAEVMLSQIRAEILPALMLAVKDSYYDTRAAAVIALGKVAKGDQADVIEAIQKTMKDEDKRVRESCCLGLGILGSKEVVPFLLKVAQNDTRTARDFFGRTEILPRTRAWASVAIGLIGYREKFSAQDEVVQELIRMARAKSRQRDLQIGPAIALQMIELEENVPAMVDMAKDEDLDNFVRAHVIVGLGKINATSAVPELVKLLGNKDTHVARSSAIALGLLTDPEDTKTVNALRRQAENGKEAGLRNFSIIALGEIGSPAGKASLVKILTRGKNKTFRTFAAISLGLMGFKHDEGKADSGKMIHDAYKKAKDELERGAYAVALALLDYEDAVDDLRPILEQGGKQKLKTHVATALGLLGDSESIPAIRKIVAQRADPDLRKAAAISLGLLRDRGAVDVLKKVIEESGSSKAILGAATVALGFVGDRQAVPILTDYVSNPAAHQDVTRAFAAVALGFLGDKDALPLLSFIHENSNYLSQTDALAELLSIL